MSPPLTSSDLPYSWRPGCPVGPSQLRRIQLGYWGFDHGPHTGSILVVAAVARSMIQVFATLFAQRFPTGEMLPVDA